MRPSGSAWTNALSSSTSLVLLGRCGRSSGCCRSGRLRRGRCRSRRCLRRCRRSLRSRCCSLLQRNASNLTAERRAGLARHSIRLRLDPRALSVRLAGSFRLLGARRRRCGLLGRCGCCLSGRCCRSRRLSSGCCRRRCFRRSRLQLCVCGCRECNESCRRSTHAPGRNLDHGSHLQC
ncbi:MAG: hypothetical protein RL291_1277 [Pseudomonadota bacterium]